MARTIAKDDCISCGACVPECPNGAISAAGDTYMIDASLCDECAATGGASACIGACPVDAIASA